MAASFQNYTDKLISSMKNKHCGIIAVVTTIYYCVFHSVISITTAFSNAKYKIYFTVQKEYQKHLLLNDCDILLTKFST